jgi:hypothetical protein
MDLLWLYASSLRTWTYIGTYSRSVTGVDVSISEPSESFGLYPTIGGLEDQLAGFLKIASNQDCRLGEKVFIRMAL